MKPKKTAAITALLGLLVASHSQAALTATSSNFSAAADISGWVSVGATPTLIKHDAFSANDFDKLDLLNAQSNALDGDGIIGNLAGDTEATGDGLLNDGGLHFDSQNATQGDEAIGLTVAGTMDAGFRYTLIVSLYNDNSSFWSGRIQLYNLTTLAVLAETTNDTIRGGTDALYIPLTWTVSYDSVPANAGQQLQIRIVENANNIARDGFIDNFSFTGVAIPEPSSLALGVIGLAFLWPASRRLAMQSR